MKKVKKEKEMKKDIAILVDIDGTLFEEVPNWSPETDAWWVKETLKMPELTTGIRLILLFKQRGYKLVFLTARGQSCKKNTWARFKKAGIDKIVDGMYHRPKYWNDLAPVEYKEKMLRRIQNKYEIAFAMDDSVRNLAMFERIGIKTIDAKIWHEVDCRCHQCS